jgi:hypothetical protein
MLSVIILNVVMLNVVMLNIVMLNIVMLNIVMLNVIMLSVVMQAYCNPTLLANIRLGKNACQGQTLQLILKKKKQNVKKYIFLSSAVYSGKWNR